MGGDRHATISLPAPDFTGHQPSSSHFSHRLGGCRCDEHTYLDLTPWGVQHVMHCQAWRPQNLQKCLFLGSVRQVATPKTSKNLPRLGSGLTPARSSSHHRSLDPGSGLEVVIFFSSMVAAAYPLGLIQAVFLRRSAVVVPHVGFGCASRPYRPIHRL